MMSQRGHHVSLTKQSAQGIEIVRLAVLIVFMLPALTFSQGVFIPNVPDENQPPTSNQNNWCTPTSALNITEYWDNVLCTAGANGVMNNWPANVANDSIGWFMDTNNIGSPNRNNTTHSGTFNKDIQPGLVEFVRWDRANAFGNPTIPPIAKVGYDWIIQTVYSNGFDFNAAEIDSGRPTIITFKYWNPIPTGLTYLDPKSNEIIYIYDWGNVVSSSPSQDNPEAPVEEWNSEGGEGGIGHAVTGVGYWRNYKPGGLPDSNWVIVHDNWSSTVDKEMAIPWKNWTSVTKLKVQPFIVDAPFANVPTIDGSISAGEYSDADSVQFIQSGDTTKVYYKVDGTNFYAAFHFTNTDASSSARIYLDTAHDQGLSPQTDDYRLTHTINDIKKEEQGTGSGWSTNSTTSGWNSAINVGANSWQAEFRISYTKLGVAPGTVDTLGISFWDAGTANGDYRWPTGAEDTVPCTWGDLVSSDLYVPVELSSFEAMVNASGQVELFWRTQTESNNYGFEVQRNAQNTAFEKIGFVPGAGTTSKPQYYDYVDQNLAPGVYFYRLKQVDLDGAFEYSQVIRAELPAARDFILHQNYPNPFNASTKLKFELPEATHVIIQIFNTKGQWVKTLIDQDYTAGIHDVVWDGLMDSQTSAPSGLYLYRLQTKNISITQKMIVIR